MTVIKEVTLMTKEAGNRELPFSEERLTNYIKRVGKIDSPEFIGKAVRAIMSKAKFKAEDVTSLLVNNALSEVDEANGHFTHIAARFYLHRLYKEASVNRSYDASEKYGDYYGLMKNLASQGLYSPHILEKYSKEEIRQAADMIDMDKDELFDYIGIYSLTDRYTASGYGKEVYELPQERWLTIALYLMQDEDKEKRMHYVSEAYWALSNLYMTVATPTLANSGKPHGQLSSCFIDTTDDSLQGIYDSNTDIANLSKYGGGIGVYMGKVRSRGSSIRKFKGASSGVLPWINTMVPLCCEA